MSTGLNFKKVGWGDIEQYREFRQLTGDHRIDAPFKLNKLLRAQPNLPRQRTPADTKLLPPVPQTVADMKVNGIGGNCSG
jgi:hypothetical protein